VGRELTQRRLNESNADFYYRMQISCAVRYADYDTIGSAADDAPNWRIALTWLVPAL